MSQIAINRPSLTEPEWKMVVMALNDLHRHQGMPSSQESLCGRFRRLCLYLGGGKPADSALAPGDDRRATLRAFVSRTRRTQRIADQFLPSLLQQGLSRPQIDAIALLSA